MYRRSVNIKRNASSLFNLGVTHYHLSSYSFPNRLALSETQTHSLVEEFDEAIHSWKVAIELQPSSADAHTSSFLPTVRGGLRSALFIVWCYRLGECLLEPPAIPARSSPSTPTVTPALGAIIYLTIILCSQDRSQTCARGP